VHGLSAQSPSGAWSSGGAILTFVVPMVVFVVVAVGLYIWYTKPSIVPGRRRPNAQHPVSYTAIPGTPLVTEVPGTVTGRGSPAADGAATAGSTKAGNRSGDAATEGGGKWRLRRRH
jgi:hypothetical protein